MPGGIKISKPERLPREGVSETELFAWWNELMNYLNQHEDFKLFKDKNWYSQWEAAEIYEDRIRVTHREDDKAKLHERQSQLHNFITIIAGCCSRDQYMMVVQQATSLKWIWNELTVIYQHQHKGKEFLSIADIEYNPNNDTPLSLYNSYRAKILENLKPAGTVLKWKNNSTMQAAETISPTFEDMILLTSMLVIDKRLPAKVKEVYGPRLQDGIYLMDLKVDILTSIPKLLAEMDEESTNINAVSFGQYSRQSRPPFSGRARGRFRGRSASSFSQQRNANNGSKFCRLCHLARQPRHTVLSHEIGDLECPSLSSRDKDGIKNKYGVNAIQVDEAVQHDVEDDIVEQMANLHGYNDQVTKNNVPPTFHNEIHVIKPVPSQILTVYQNQIPIHLDLDSGCWISTVRLDFAEKMQWKIHPNGQLAKIADGKTILKAKGEIHEQFQRNSWTVNFSAIVMEDLHTDVIAGNNFFLDNSVCQNFSAKNITVHNKYVVPETNRHTALPTLPINTIITLPKAKTLLPNQRLEIDVPAGTPDVIFVEPTKISQPANILPQICTVNKGKICVENSSSQPVTLSKQALHVKQVSTPDIKMDVTYKAATISVRPSGLDNIKDITTNMDRLSITDQHRLQQILRNKNSVFDQDLSIGYNQYSGPHYCRLKFANEERPSSRKVNCVQYNNAMNVLLQQVCDQLTHSNVLGVPQHENVDVQHVMPCFLRKKQKAKDKKNSELTVDDVRLVVNTCELSKYMKSLPAKVNKPQEVYNTLAKWRYIIKTDLYQGFFQNHLHKEAQKWCAIITPFGGMRFFKRGIQGLINQTEELDELLANIFNKMLTEGKLVKQADDLFTGGQTVKEALDNLDEMLTICQMNNIKLSPSKTVILPKTVDIMSWIWTEGGTLTPSPHRKQALVQVQHEDLKTVRDVRSWVGLYKTFLYHTPNISNILDPFDKIVGDKQSNDVITWTTELKQALQNAKDHVKNIKEVYLPHPDEQLLILTDGARNPPGVGFVLQAKDSQGNLRTVRHYSVKLKPHHIKWSPCEIESVAFGTAIEAFYDIIKESTKPVIICPDSKPVCDATKLLQKGKFSLSPRIQTFLNNVGKIACEVQHISGKSGQNFAADFQSRNTQECNAEVCQICNYINCQSDTIIDVKAASLNPVQDVHDDHEINVAPMPMLNELPYSNRIGWKNVQLQDKAIVIAKNAIVTGQIISKKPGKPNADARKFVSQANLSHDGLLVVQRAIPFSTDKEERIVVPSSYVPTIVRQMHNENSHPSKSQLKHLFDKYFFAVGVNRCIDEFYEKCHLCCALKKLPVTTHHTTTTTATTPGTHFGCDIIKRCRQKILVLRDQFSSYTAADFIDDETSTSIETALIRLITPLRHPGRVVVRSDQATGFVKIQKSRTLQELQIEIELGNSLNKNSNAVVDKAIQELEKEITIICPEEKPINQVVLAQAVTNLNGRLRRDGKISARGILFSRDDKTGNNLHLQDEMIAKDQIETRHKNNDNYNKHVKIIQSNVTAGDHVMLVNNPAKHRVRETFEIIDDEGDMIQMKKVQRPGDNSMSKLRKKIYTVPAQRVFKVQKPVQNRQQQYKAPKNTFYDPVRRVSSSSDDTTDEEIPTTMPQPPQHAQTDVRTTGARPKIRERWFVSVSPIRNISQPTLTRNVAATKIQQWYRKLHEKRSRNRYYLRQRRNKTPELVRSEITDDSVLLSQQEERNFTSDSNDTLDWDSSPECTELHTEPDVQQENFFFSDESTDFMRVYNFSNVLPLSNLMPLYESQVELNNNEMPTELRLKQKTRKINKVFQYFRNLLKK